MNSSRRGAAYGFKLESLGKITDTKSRDKKQTLLHYIVHVVEKVFPNVLTFHEELDIDTACSGPSFSLSFILSLPPSLLSLSSLCLPLSSLSLPLSSLSLPLSLLPPLCVCIMKHTLPPAVSLSVVSEDVSGLRQGLKVLEKEMEMDADNFVIFISSKQVIATQ